MKIIIKNDYYEVSKLAASYVIDIVKKNNCAVLGLPTGSTPVYMYKILSREYKNGSISFGKIKTFNLDEYIGLPKTNKNSFYYFMNHNFFSKVDIKEKNIFIPDGMAKNIEEECSKYENIIKSSNSMDILFLGIGHNGHIGFNEPSEYFEPYTHMAKLMEDTVEANSRFFGKAEDVPKIAITMGIKTIFSAKKIVLLAAGKSKSESVAKALNGKITPMVPASILQLHSDVTVIVDKAAGSMLNIAK